MISVETNGLIAELFTLIAKGEFHIESIRLNASNQPLFHPHTAFTRIDRHCAKLISANDIHCFLRDSNRELSLEHCFYFLHFFDSNDDGFLDYEDFCTIVLPTTKLSLKKSVLTRPYFVIPPDEFLPYDIEGYLADLLHSECILHRALEDHKQRLACRFDFSVKHIFDNIKDPKSKMIELKDIKTFVKKCNIPMDVKLLSSLIRRIDKDEDNKISVDEFRDSIVPVERDSIQNPGFCFPTKAFLMQTNIHKA